MQKCKLLLGDLAVAVKNLPPCRKATWWWQEISDFGEIFICRYNSPKACQNVNFCLDLNLAPALQSKTYPFQKGHLVVARKFLKVGEIYICTFIIRRKRLKMELMFICPPINANQIVNPVGERPPSVVECKNDC